MTFITLTLASIAFACWIMWSMSEANEASRDAWARSVALDQYHYAGLMKSPRFDPILLVMSLGSLGIARWVYGAHGWTWIGGLIGLGLVIFFVTSLIINLERLTESVPVKKRANAVAALIMTVGAVYCGYGNYRDAANAQNRRLAEKEVVLAIGYEKKGWALPDGVTESRDEKLIGWLAFEQHVDVDWKYEEQLEQNGKATRRIPITIVLLNNSFNDLPFEPDISGTLWRAWISRANLDEQIVQWQHNLQLDERIFPPIRRADFEIDWDGRDRHGALLGPGNYTVHVETAATGQGGHMRLEQSLVIADAGAEEKFQPDAMSEYFREQQRWGELNRGMQDITEMQQRMMLDQMRWSR